jgi:hypothetical protein
MSDSLFRVYEEYECGADGYPRAWHKGKSDVAPSAIKDLVRLYAGNRCVRCGHPYMVGAHGKGEWSPCDEQCRHGGPTRMNQDAAWRSRVALIDAPPDQAPRGAREAQWRILTVHHLNGNKRDCRWWNLVALCQRCHLTIQGKVKMDRPYDRQHSAWFVPYVAGFYAAKYLGEDLTPEEALARADELLALEFRQDALFPSV